MGYAQFDKSAIKNELSAFDLTRTFSLQGGGLLQMASAPEVSVDSNTLEQNKIKHDPSPT